MFHIWAASGFYSAEVRAVKNSDLVSVCGKSYKQSFSIILQDFMLSINYVLMDVNRCRNTIISLPPHFVWLWENSCFTAGYITSCKLRTCSYTSTLNTGTSLDNIQVISVDKSVHLCLEEHKTCCCILKSLSHCVDLSVNEHNFYLAHESTLSDQFIKNEESPFWLRRAVEDLSWCADAAGLIGL